MKKYFILTTAFLFFVITFESMALVAKASPFDIYTQINLERTNAGLNPLKVNKALCVAARNKALDMIVREYFGHVDPDGNKVFDLIKDYPGKSLGENLALNLYGTDLIQGWMISAEHRENILNTRYADTCVANFIFIDSSQTTRKIYTVQLFGGK